MPRPLIKVSTAWRFLPYELYTMQRYLQYNTLRKNDLHHFDSWASTFGENVTSLELSPEGSGYRAKTRFARFYNLPELMSMFKGVADIQTADMLKLPVPKANYHNVVIKPTEMQKEMVASLADRAEDVRNNKVKPNEDNMLLITNDGRKIALDQRLLNPLLPDEPNSKVSTCANNVYDIWNKTKEDKLTQLIFCDMSTPHNDGEWNVYEDISKKLIKKGVPKEEVAFIHDANNETKKKELFAKVRKGDVRVLIGSTPKLGSGTNIQDKLVALHDLDIPWRPSDLEQRSGRILRQGNTNPEVEIFRYVTEQTFDAYIYQLIEGKQKFISQIMTAKSPARSGEDVDETVLSYAEIKALAAGNPMIKQKMDMDIAVARLKVLKSNYLSQKYSLEDKIAHNFPIKIQRLKEKVAGYEKDIAQAKTHSPHIKSDDGFINPATINHKVYTDKSEAGKAILDEVKNLKSAKAEVIGNYRGFELLLSYQRTEEEYMLTLKNALSHNTFVSVNGSVNINRLDKVITDMENDLANNKEYLSDIEHQLKNALEDVDKPFNQEDELTEKQAKLREINATLNYDNMKSGEEQKEQNNEEEPEM